MLGALGALYYVLTVAWGVYAVREWRKGDWHKVERAIANGWLTEDECAPFHRLDRQHTKWDLLHYAVGVLILLPIRLAAVFVISVATSCSLIIAETVLDAATFRTWHGLHTYLRGLIRSGLFVLGVTQIRESGVLGRDQPPKQLKHVVVCNHVSALDILVFLERDFASFVAKASVRRIPLIGKCAQVVGTIFVDRSSDDNRERALQAVLQRQHELASMEDTSNHIAPLVMFAEGTTSSGRTLLPFKRGAFYGMQPVTPVVLSYTASFFHPSYDILHYTVWLPLLLISPTPIHVNVHWLPDIDPPPVLSGTSSAETRLGQFMSETRCKMCEALGVEPSPLDPDWNRALVVKRRIRMIFKQPFGRKMA